jgi:hypothetical protein
MNFTSNTRLHVFVVHTCISVCFYDLCFTLISCITSHYKVIVMLIVILAVFAVCWCPIQITVLYSEYRGNHTQRVSRREQKHMYIHVLVVHSTGKVIRVFVFADFLSPTLLFIRSTCMNYFLKQNKSLINVQLVKIFEISQILELVYVLS